MRSNVSFPLVMMIAEIGALRNRDGEVRDERGLLDVIKAWSDAGVNVIQIRGGGHTDRELVEFVRRVLMEVNRKQTSIVVNDRPDIALVVGADGLHIKDDGSAASEIRSLGPVDWLVGCSVHSLSRASSVALDGGADYVLAGNVFPTDSKPGKRGLGLEELRNIVTASTVPVVAVGGVCLSNISDVAGTGICGIAAIGSFLRDYARSREDRAALVSSCYRQLGRTV